MRSHRSLPGLLAVLGLGTAAGAQLVDVPSVENFVRRNGASATVIGNYVYLDGGEISQILDGKRPADQSNTSNQVNSTISIDISKSWTTSDVVMRAIERPWASKKDQAIWTDQDAGEFYVWAGAWLGGKHMTENELWKFTVDGTGGGTWALELPSNPTLFEGLTQTDYPVFANTPDIGFAIGGMATGWTDKGRAQNQAIPGMVAFNMKTKLWHNGTTSFSPVHTIAAGSAHYIPDFGPDGLVMVLGGYAPPVDENLDWTLMDPYNLRNLTFFNPQTKETYWQVATGDIPDNPRTQFCLAGFRNPDGGYDILLTGGYNHRDQITYSDTYILSLPGFVWTKAADIPTGGRRLPACVAVGNRQVLSIGGTIGLDFRDADPAPQGLQLFDMTEMKWKDSYDADAAPYERPPAIKAWYSNGSLDAVEWSSNQVQKLFATARTTTGGSEADPSSTGGPSTTGGADPESQSAQPTPVGAIVGGVVGGIAGIAIIAFVAWFLVRRRTQDKNAELASGGDDTYEHYAPEVVKGPVGGSELQGSDGKLAELTSEREYRELGGSTAYRTPDMNYMAVAEMDATPITR